MRLAIFNLLDPVTGRFVVPADEMEVKDKEGAVVLGKGGVRYKGTATMWKDMVGDLFGKRLNNTTGKVDYDWGTNSIKFQPGGLPENVIDRVQMNIQVDHNMALSSEYNGDLPIRPHIHWFQDVGSTNQFTMRLYYRHVKNGGIVDLSLTPDKWDYKEIVIGAGSSADKFDVSGLTSGTVAQISVFPDIVADLGLSDTFQFILCRTDAATENCRVFFFDCHMLVSSAGSDTEWVK